MFDVFQKGKYAEEFFPATLNCEEEYPAICVKFTNPNIVSEKIFISY